MADMVREFPPIEWDGDGYPTEESLTELRLLDFTAFSRNEAASYLRAELAKCAKNCCASYEELPATDGITDEPCLRLHFSTGGWSGAEDMLDAMIGKFWIAHLQYQWNRGGHYIFDVPYG